MARTLNAAERREKMEIAVELAVRGKSYAKIGEELGVSRPTAIKLVQDELARRAEQEDGHERQQAIAVYRMIIEEGWRRLETLKDTSLNVSGVLNSIRSAQERIDKITGTEAPIKHQQVDQEIIVEWEDLDSVFADSQDEEG